MSWKFSSKAHSWCMMEGDKTPGSGVNVNKTFPQQQNICMKGYSYNSAVIITDKYLMENCIRNVIIIIKSLIISLRNGMKLC